jgi:DNA polymerase III subunit delta
LNLETLYGSETTAEEILSRAETLPLLGSRRVVVVRDADHLPAKDLEKVVDRLEKDPCPHACLIFLAQRVDRRTSVFRSFQRAGKAISCTLTEPEAVHEWVQRSARQKGKRLTPPAVETLMDSVGEDLNLLAGELEKVILLVGEREEIQAEDILALSGRRTHHIFEVMEALGYGKASEVLSGIRSLLEAGEEPLSVLGMMSRHFRLFSKAKQMDSAGNSRADIARQLRIPPRYLQSLLAHVPSIPWNVLEGFFEALLRSDSYLKSGKVLGTLEMERLIVDFCWRVRKILPQEKAWLEDQSERLTF